MVSLVIALLALAISLGTVALLLLHRRSVHRRLDAITRVLETLSAYQRDDGKILKAIGANDSDMKLGIGYIGGRMHNIALIMQDHDTRISNNEKMTGAIVKRPRMPHFVTPPAPSWLPSDSQVPDVDLAPEGRPSDVPPLEKTGAKR